MPFDAGEIHHIEPDLFIVAGIIPLIEGVARAEFCADRVPDELEELYALLGSAVRAAIVLVDQRTQVVAEELLVARRCYERAAAEPGGKQLMDLGPTVV